MTYRTDPWMALCAGRACIACGRNDGTTVAAHSNEQRFGKGMGIKAASWTCLPLCRECHDFQHTQLRKEEVGEWWAKHWAFHMIALCQAGMVEPVKPEYRIPRFVPRNPDGWGPKAA